MSNILIVPDKFKGTLSAQAAAKAISRGWGKVRPLDTLQLVPMSDGGDGFGEVIGQLIGARQRSARTVNAAHQAISAPWWWQPESGTAVVESARVIGLAMLPSGKFHPFQLDTFGLGRVLRIAEKQGATRCVVGIGGSATNDGGFGMARAVGWEFLDHDGKAITEWWQLDRLARIDRPATRLKMAITVAVDVRNPLLGRQGCSRIYGPQKGLRVEDFALAEACLGRLAAVLKEQHGLDFGKIPGAGAAGGLGFGLMAFAGAECESGFEIFSKHAKLGKRIAAADLVITGEGAIDAQTYMGKGVGRIALLCRKAKVPCIGLAGVVEAPGKGRSCFSSTVALTSVTSVENAKKNAAKYLEVLARDAAGMWRV